MAWDDVLVAHVSKYTAAIHNEMVTQIKARILHSLDTEANGVLVGTGAGAFIFKTITQFKTILSLTKTDVGLSNVDNVAQMPASYLDTDATFAANSDSKVPSQKAIKSAALNWVPPLRSFFLPTYLYSYANVEKVKQHVGFIVQQSAANGDYFIIPAFCSGYETILEISYYKSSSRGKFDIYISTDGGASYSLDSSGYDGYSASPLQSIFSITLSIPVVSGWNLIKMIVNGKNDSAASYILSLYGVCMR